MTLNDEQRRPRRGWILWLALLLVVALIVLFGALRPRQEEVKPAEEKAYPVRVLTVTPRPVTDRIELPGRIEPLQEAVLAAEKPGQVVERLADRGDVVKAGQVLLRVDARTWEAVKQRAEVEARDADRDFRRWKELEKTGAVSASDFEAIRRRKEMAEIALNEAEVFLSQCEIRAPFDGVVNDRFLEVGDHAGEGQAAFRLVRLDRVKVAFDVPEQDVFAVRPGADMAFEVAARPGRTFTGRVSYVSSQAARESNSFAVDLEADNADGLLRAGLIATVSLVRRERADAIIIPLAAVLPRKGEHLVFVVENSLAVRRRVYLDTLVGHEVVLSGGLNAGEQLVVEGHRGLQDGMKVRPTGEPVDAAPANPEP